MTSHSPPSNTAPPPDVRTRIEQLIAAVRNSPIRSATALAASVLIGVAGAPLAIRVWEALWSLPHAGRVLLCGVGLILLTAVAVSGGPIPWAQKVAKARLGALIACAWAVVLVVVVLMVGGVWWVMGTPRPNFPEALALGSLNALATRAFAVVAALGAAALLVIQYRRQRTTEADAVRAEATADREVTKLFNERFTAAYTELGSDHAAVRLGAVHALAHLADDAPSDKEVQMVIDVLCAYLRMPYAPAPGRLPEGATKEEAVEHREQDLEFASFREVRHTIIRIIGNHLSELTRWRGKNFDFTGTVFDGGDLSGACFTAGTVSFVNAHFTGRSVDFSRSQFSGGTVNFHGIEVSGEEVNFALAEFSGGVVDFREAQFSGEGVEFGAAQFSGGVVDFRETHFTCERATFHGANFSGGWVDFREAQFSGGVAGFSGTSFSGGSVNFRRVEFSGEVVSFRGVRISRERVNFGGARFSGEEVDFRDAQFSGGLVNFGGSRFSRAFVNFGGSQFSGGVMAFPGSQFSGGSVDFREAQFSGGSVDFSGALGRRPYGLLEVHIAPGVVVLPESWQEDIDENGG